MENLNSSSDADVRKVMKMMKMNWEDAWTYIRCQELEDGASICCSEECEEHDSAVLELVMAAEAGAEKREARQSGRALEAPAREAPEESEESDTSETSPQSIQNSDTNERMKRISEPLVATTDALKLKELEERFPDGTIMLYTSYSHGAVKYVYEDMYEDSSANHFIMFNEGVYSFFKFIPSKTQFRISVHWAGASADLSHFF
jgi:hypothetical protein